MKTSSSRPGIRGVASFSAALALLTLGPGSALALDQVVYGTASRVGIANASMFFAEAKGFFEEEGIDISTVQFDGTGVLLPQIANKSVTVGYPIPDFLVISNDTGKDPLPIKYFYNVNRLYNWEIAVPADSDIKTLADLKGKRLGVNSLSTGNVPATRAMLSEVGLTAGTDVELIATPQGAAAINALRTGQVDAINFFDVFHDDVERAGIPLRKLELPERYKLLFGNSFAAHVDTFRDNPDLLIRFGRAYSKGLVSCYENPENCIRTMWKMHPSTKPTEGDEETNLAQAVETLKKNLGFKMPEGYPDDPKFGHFDTVGWDTLLSVLTSSGTVRDASMDLSKLYTNEFVEEFGDFDIKAAIKKGAGEN